MNVMFNQGDAQTLRFQFLNKLCHHLCFMWAKGSGRFVHDQDLGAKVDRPSNGDRLALATLPLQN
jgi:hypothetical protein